MVNKSHTLATLLCQLLWMVLHPEILSWECHIYFFFKVNQRKGTPLREMLKCWCITVDITHLLKSNILDDLKTHLKDLQ